MSSNVNGVTGTDAELVPLATSQNGEKLESLSGVGNDIEKAVTPADVSVDAHETFGAFVKSTIKTIFKKQMIPGLVLQAFAITLVILYYNVDAVKDVCKEIGDLKSNWSYGFSAISTSLCGGAIPYLIILTQKPISSTSKKLKDFLFYCIYWAYKGVEVDLLYRGMAELFGDDADVFTVAKKVLVDQFVYNVFWGVHSVVIPFAWCELNFSFSALWVWLKTPGIYLEKFVTTCLTVWMIWCPTVTAIYSLPLNLQVPLFNIVLIFSSLIFINLNSKDMTRKMTTAVR